MVREDYEWLEAMLKKWRCNMIRHGAAEGVDMACDTWASRNFYPRDPHPVSREDWNKYKTRSGKSYAGIRRNTQMAETLPVPVVCIAFPGKKGTTNMIQTCHKKGIPVEVQDEDRFIAWSNIVRDIAF